MTDDYELERQRFLATQGAGSSSPDDEYESARRQFQFEQLDSALTQVQDDPTRAAEIERFASDRQMTVDAVRENLDTLRKQKRQDEIAAADLPRSAPVTAEFLADPSNAAVAGSEWSLLRSLETLGKSALAGRYDVPAAVAGNIGAAAETVGGIADILNYARRLAGITPEEAIARTMVGQRPVIEPTSLPSQIGQRALAEAEAFKYTGDQSVGDLSTAPWLLRAASSGIRSASSSAVDIGLALLTGSPTPLVAGGALRSQGQSYAEARQQGVVPGFALTYSGAYGAVEKYTEMLPSIKLLENVALKSPMVKAALDFAKAEVPGELAATTLQKFLDYTALPENADKTAADFARELPADLAETFVATLVGGAAQVGVATGVGKLLGEQRQSTVEQDSLDQMIELATNSKVREADPERFKTFLQSATGGRTVYVAQEDVAKVAQNGLSFPPEVLKQLDGSGADVAITLRDVLGNPEIAAQLRDSIRIRPGGMTKAELSTEGKSQIDEILRNAATQKQQDDEIDQLAERIVQEYAATGVANERDARTSVEVTRSYLRTILANPRYADLTPAELADMVGLRVAGPGTPQRAAPTESARVMEQDAALAGADLSNPQTVADAQREWAVNRTESPYFKRWFGDSKVVDDSGKPLVVYHGTTVDFDWFDTKKSGQKDVGWYGSGIYFSANTDTAGAYSAYGRDGETFRPIEDREAKAPVGARVMPVYVALKNPYRWPEGRPAATSRREAYAIQKELIEAGYDGVIVSNRYESSGPKRDFYEVVAFRPEQIKSAIGNRSTFDPGSPSILNQPPIDATGITLTEEVQIAETGETVTVEQDAQRLYDQSVKRLEMLKRVQECLARG